MALIACKDCGRIISSEARACPWCGRQSINLAEVMMGTGIALMLLAGVLAVLYAAGNMATFHVFVNGLVHTVGQFLA